MKTFTKQEKMFHQALFEIYTSEMEYARDLLTLIQVSSSSFFSKEKKKKKKIFLKRNY